MEKNIKCPECGDEAEAEFGMCPTCNYEYDQLDYKSQGVAEENFTNLEEIPLAKGDLFGKIKVIGFIVVLFFIIFIFINK